MIVILKKDVPGTGKAGEVVKVSMSNVPVVEYPSSTFVINFSFP